MYWTTERICLEASTSFQPTSRLVPQFVFIVVGLLHLSNVDFFLEHLPTIGHFAWATWFLLYEPGQAIAIRLEAMAIRLQAIASRLEAIAIKINKIQVDLVMILAWRRKRRIYPAESWGMSTVSCTFMLPRISLFSAEKTRTDLGLLRCPEASPILSSVCRHTRTDQYY